MSNDLSSRQPANGAKKKSFCENITYHISNGLDKLFYRLGYKVATHPWNTILISVFMVLLCSGGLVFFYHEKNPIKLWIPQDSRFIRDTHWIMNTIQVGYRSQSVLITAPDVLKPNVLLRLAQISQQVEQIQIKLNNGTTIGWTDICFKIPIIADLPEDPSKALTPDNDNTSPAPNLLDSILNFGRNRPFNPSIDMNPFLYCQIVENLPLGCMSQNLLELWKFDDKRLQELSKEDILSAINRTTISPVTGHNTNFVQLLGGISRNSSGHIVAASSILTNWMVYVNFTDIDHRKIGNSAGTEDWASEEALAWEGEWLHQMEAIHSVVNNNDTSMFFYSAGRSFGDISSGAIFQEMDNIFIGGFLMFIYMLFVLSKFGWTEMRILFGGMGLLSVGMAFVATIGLCSLLGVAYGPVHTSLPFLLMGLGVDDIFVLMSCWRQVESMNTSFTLPKKVGLMLKHAGSSITVTSITDVVAFLIGASTILPSLESFCIYAAVGVFIMYLLVITFVVAILTLDERRIEQKRNAIIPCLVHTSDEQTKLCCDLKLMPRALNTIYSKCILTKPGKIIIIVLTLGLSSFSVKGLLRLEQKFDPAWFIPERTYLHKYLQQQTKFYPDIGFEATVFVGAINYTHELPKILNALDDIKNQTHLVQDINAWIYPFQKFVLMYFEKDISKIVLTDEQWREYLSKFLFSSSGGNFQLNFKFDGPLRCGNPTPNVTVSSVPFHYRRFQERNEYVTAMHRLERIVDDMQLETGDRFATVWGKVYGNWVTDEVIDTEVLRNVILALICVMGCTLILIANLPVCAYICGCVLLTLVNVCGFMQFWGLTIDLVSCIGLELAVGLCVDYAVHIGHTFLTIKDGNRNERVLETILQIGSAVIYGGGSTLLALAMLAKSEAYTFNAFFKIFLLVIVFGLFHGVVFLPVVLSIIGPDPYIMQNSNDKPHEEDEIKSFIQPESLQMNNITPQNGVESQSIEAIE